MNFRSPARSNKTSLPPLGDIDFGAPDANAEQQIAARTHSVPAFVRSFVTPPLLNFDGFLNGTKFFLSGQKGTGKTAIFRYIDRRTTEASSAKTAYIVFRDEILEESDLSSLDWQIVLDDNKIKETKHYLHCMKRLLLSVIISNAEKLEITDDDDEEIGPVKEFVKRLQKSKAADVFNLVIDSIESILSQTSIDVSKATKGIAHTNPTRLVKKQNDALFSYACRVLKGKALPLRIFVDELHFAYRDTESMKQDAMLVRDTLIAIANLNDRLHAEGIDCVIYAAFRAEFFEHPIISAAEINNTMLSFGESLSWSTFPLDIRHPILEIVSKRIGQAIKRDFYAKDVFKTYLANVDAVDLLMQTWGKPRDVIRFMNEAKKMFPKKVTLSTEDYRAALRNYCKESWKEIETALSAFLDVTGIEKFRALLRDIAPRSFSERIPMSEFLSKLETFHKSANVGKKNGITFEALTQILFVIGIFGTRTVDKNGVEIYYMFHRGNEHPDLNGTLELHRTIARAFS